MFLPALVCFIVCYQGVEALKTGEIPNATITKQFCTYFNTLPEEAKELWAGEDVKRSTFYNDVLCTEEFQNLLEEVAPLAGCKTDEISAQIDKTCGEMPRAEADCSEVVKSTKCHTEELEKVCKVDNVDAMAKQFYTIFAKLPEYSHCGAEILAAMS
ncbi:unnamed protein product, partial [Mesorhabditis belari]|uniref:Uncharacterized protein n=1 Tax=Mesorhabditis belari TaxID=2138241 RepID=A0AAF3EFN5_9BILA